MTEDSGATSKVPLPRAPEGEGSGAGSPPVVQPTIVTPRPVPGPRPQLHSIELSVYAGPIPDPNLLGGFERVLPGAADRIVKNWETESEHRRCEERKTRSHERWMDYLRTVAVAGLCVFLTSTAADLLQGGHKIEAYATFLAQALPVIWGLYRNRSTDQAKPAEASTEPSKTPPTRKQRRKK